MRTEDNKEARCVLLVEDDEVLATFTSRALELEGYRVIQTPTSDKAITIIQTNWVDLVLLDLMLENGDEGWNVLERIKNTPQFSGIPVIVYTAAIEQSNQERAVNMGATAFLTKPVGVQELKEIVNSVINQNSRDGLG